MSGPTQVRLKRRRDEPAPDTLIVEQAGNKRAVTEDGGAVKLQYKRQRAEDEGAVAARDALAQAAAKRAAEEETERAATEAAVEAVETAARAGGAFSKESVAQRVQDLKTNGKNKDKAKSVAKDVKRTFHLTRVQKQAGVSKRKRAKGGKDDDGDIATFEEKRVRTRARGAGDTAGPVGTKAVQPKVAPATQQLKRPGRGSAVSGKRDVPSQARTAETAEQRRHMEAMANSFHQFAIDEATSAPKPKITALPKFATRRRNINGPTPTPVAPEPRIKDDEMDLDDDSDYVYDTYFLAAPDSTTTSGPDTSGLGDIGYLIITDEDQSLWEAYMEDEASDKEFDTDDEDSNAEDYYGADYPEDELASDDEYDRGAYNYRRHGGSDDEEWDEDTGAYSGEEEDEYERTMNPWKSRVPSQAARVGGGDDEDSE